MLPRLAQLSKDSIIYGIGGAAVRYTGLILLPIYTRAFTTGEYGVLESINNLGALLLAVAMLGLDGAAPLLYFETDEPQERRRITSLWVWLCLAVSVPVTLLLIIFADLVSLAASGTTANANLFRLGVAALPFSLVLGVFSNILRFTFRPRHYALLNFSLTTLVALISIYLVLFTPLGLAGALWGILLGTAAVAIAGAWLVGDSVRIDVVGRDAWPAARRLLKLGFPLVPASLALWVISFSNTYFLIQLAGAEEAGIFRAGARVAALLGIGLLAFQLAWGPFSLSLAREPDAPLVYSRVATLYTAGAVGASVLLAALAPILLRILTGPDYAEASSVIGLLALGAAALGAYYVVAIGVNLAQRTGQIAWTTIAAAAVSLALNALLIPLWGIVGAGLASLAANLTSTALVYTVSQRYHPLPYRYYKLLGIWLVGSACVAAAAIFNAAAHPPIWLSLLFAPALTALYTAALFGGRVVSLREIRAARDLFSRAVARRVGG